MNFIKKNVNKIVVWGIVIILVICGIRFCVACKTVDDFTVSVAKEDMNTFEYLACLAKGYDVNTKQELINQGIIFSDEMQTGCDIKDIIKPVVEAFGKEYKQLDIEKEILNCDDATSKLHEKNKSKKINNDDLKSLMEDSLNMVEYYKYSLEAYRDVNVDKFKAYSDKSLDTLKKVNNDLERIGF